MSETKSRPDGPLTASVEKLRHELDRWMEVALSQGERALGAFGIRAPGGPWSPDIDITETADELLVDVDLPGIDPKSVEITLAGNMLTIEGEKTARAEKDGDSVHVQERLHGSFSRSIPLPLPVNAKEVSAEAKNGVMQIRLTKSDGAKTKHIKVNVEHSN